MGQVGKRKLEHLDLCANKDVESQRSSLLDEVGLFHEALPELSAGQINLSTELLGRRLQAPVLISGMTGGAQRAGEINRALAAAAQKYGFGMGLGSQRAMWLDPELANTYQVRDVAPDILLLANLGAVQARDVGVSATSELIDAVRADALCLHLNVAQELVQDEGDRDFRGCLASIESLVDSLPVPVIVKETGCGFSPMTLDRLKSAGVCWIDVAGHGGTTWTGVEALRGSSRQRQLGKLLREWGIPTAASIRFARERSFGTIASGGIRGPLDIVRAMALGAHATGLALPFFRANEGAGLEGVLSLAEQLTEGIGSLMLLLGASSIEELRRLPYTVGPNLRAWLDDPDTRHGEHLSVTLPTIDRRPA